MRTLQDRVREAFGDVDSVRLDYRKQEIQVYYIRDGLGRVWIPFGGGPLYNQRAILAAAEVAYQIEDYRELLPKSCRDWTIRFGELNTRDCPENFWPAKLPTREECKA